MQFHNQQQRRSQIATNHDVVSGGAYPWPQDNLSAEYFFDGDLTDNSGNGLDLTASGIVTTAAGYLDVNNTAYVYRNSSTLMNGATSFSVSFWWYINTEQGNTTFPFLGRSSNTWRFYMWLGKFRILLYPGALYGDLTDAVVPVNTWNHFAVTWSANGSVQCWLNNSLQSTTVSTPSLAAIASDTNPFRVLYNQYGNSDLDNLLIYENKVLTTDEIAGIYNYGRVTP